MKIRILHILHSLHVGGLENGVVNLINNLDTENFEHSICCIDSSGPMAKRMINPVSLFSLGKGGGRKYLIALKIARIIRQVKPDIVHTRNWSAIDGIIGSRLAGHRTVIHGEHGREASDPMGRVGRRKKIRKALSPWVNQFITVSTELKDWLIRDVGITAEKVTQIINGVDTDVIRPGEDKGNAKSHLGLSSDTFVIGCVGRLDAVKDHETLLRAFSISKNRNSGRKLALLIVGTGPLTGELRQRSKELDVADSVYFMGHQDEVIHFYQSMDAYVLPSIAEGISNTILEAMASELPVLASRVGGNLELVDHEQTGFFFPPGDVEELALLIDQYVRKGSLAREHGLRGRQRTVNKFSIHQMTEKYAALYESFCHRECATAALS